MNSIAISPFLIPLTVALILAFVRGQIFLKWLATVASLLVICALSVYMIFEAQTQGPLVATMAGWPAPVGIAVVVDGFAALMLGVSALIGVSVLLFQYTLRNQQTEYYYSLILFLFVGVNGSFIAGDLFNLYVCFEIMVISSFVLIAQNLEKNFVTAAIRYVTANLLSSLLFLTGVGLVYGLTGRLNFAELSVYTSENESSAVLAAAGALLLFAFGIKSALFPVNQWLPHSYPAVHPALGALFAGLLTKVGVYAIFRTVSLLFQNQVAMIQQPLLWIAAATMVTGVLAAAMQKNIRSILSYHIISQVGYMLLGIATYTLTGFFGAIFYLLHHIIAKSNLFLIAAIIEKKSGSGDLSRIGGLSKASPWLALCFIAPALALAGLPPFSGFFAKYIVIKGAFEIGAYAVGGSALFVGLITLYSMSKIWNAAFWSPKPEGSVIVAAPLTMALPIIVLSILSLVTGLAYPWIAPYLQESASALLAPEPYIDAVLGGGR